MNPNDLRELFNRVSDDEKLALTLQMLLRDKIKLKEENKKLKSVINMLTREE